MPGSTNLREYGFHCGASCSTKMSGPAAAKYVPKEEAIAVMLTERSFRIKATR
jgi:hypothetical protein